MTTEVLVVTEKTRDSGDAVAGIVGLGIVGAGIYFFFPKLIAWGMNPFLSGEGSSAKGTKPSADAPPPSQHTTLDDLAKQLGEMFDGVGDRIKLAAMRPHLEKAKAVGADAFLTGWESFTTMGGLFGPGSLMDYTPRSNNGTDEPWLNSSYALGADSAQRYTNPGAWDSLVFTDEFGHDYTRARSANKPFEERPSWMDN